MSKVRMKAFRPVYPSPAALIGSATGGKVVLIAGLSKDLVERGLNASDWVKTAAKVVEHFGCTGRRDPLGAEDVLVRVWYAA